MTSKSIFEAPTVAFTLKTVAISAAVFVCLLLLGLVAVSVSLLYKQMDEKEYIDQACLSDIRDYSASNEKLFKYRIKEIEKDKYRWIFDVGPAAHDLWFVHESTFPGVFADLAEGRIVHIEAGEVASFMSSEFDKAGARNSRPFNVVYSYSFAPMLEQDVLRNDIQVTFPIVGNSEVMQTASDGAVINYAGFKDWPKSHTDPEALQSVDIRAPQGTEIISAAAGTVVEVSQENRDLGCRSIYVGLTNRLIVLGENGLQYEYAHIQKMSSFVKVGDRVRAGARLALVGKSGGSSEPHLHFSVQTMLPEGVVTSLPVDFLPCKKRYRGGPARNGVVSCSL